MLTLSTDKGTAKKLTLATTKASRFTVKLFWDSEHDIDAHALLGRPTPEGNKVQAYEEILSTYNLKRPGNPNGTLSKNPDGSFGIPCGALQHTGDSRTGLGKQIDEVITVDGGRVPAGVTEIFFFASIHPSKTLKFREVKDIGISIEDDSGKELGRYNLGTEFGHCDTVQMGSIIISDQGLQYFPVGVGFDGGIDAILGNYS